MKYPYTRKNAIACLIGLLLCSTAALWAQPGMIDSTYGNNGVVLVDIDTGSFDQAYSVIIQPDGKAVAAGYSVKGDNYNGALIRVTEDGSLDPDFGTDGVVLSDLGSDDRFYTVALDEHQHIIAGGFSNDGDFAVVRYLPDGSPDESFGTNGVVFTDIRNDFDYIQALALQADGKIVAAGASADPDNPDGAAFALVRYTSEGSPDTSFGDQGKVLTQIGPGWDDVWAMVIQADGKLLVGGQTEHDPYNRLCMARYNPDGTLDTSFGSDGIVVDTFTSAYSVIFWMGLTPDRKIVVGGRAGQTQGIARYHKDGTPDPTFNGAGKFVLPLSSGINDLRSGIVTADGKIVVGGSGRLSANTYNFLVGRINPDGSVDTTFGENGFLKRRITFGGSGVYSLASTPDGNLIAAGYGFDGSGNFALVKCLNDLAVSALNFKSPAREVLVYPNPIADQAVLRYELEEGQPVTIRLLDAAGRPVKVFVRDQWQVPGRYQQTIDIPGTLPSGFYLIQIISPNGQVAVRVIK